MAEMTVDRLSILDRAERLELEAKAHRLYEANTHLFGDEFEARRALGAYPAQAIAYGRAS
ncbi:MAG TPA: hypothetical protein VKD67_10990 [Acidimicrobiales bacterium]|nr:hypothetical protein [Acidimicrobiales bacterium]